MITIEKDIVASNILFWWLRGNLCDSFGSIGNGRHLFVFFFVKRTRERAAFRAGSKKECLELCNFHFCCAFIFGQPMKQFEFFGASRATRQRHFKTSSTGDENDSTLALVCYCRSRDHSQFVVVLWSWAWRPSWDIGEVTLLRQTRFSFLKEMSFSHAGLL